MAQRAILFGTTEKGKYLSQNKLQFVTTLAKLGYCLFPIAPDSKIPVIKWSQHSTCSLTAVEAWWKQFPDDNIGIDCGQTGLLVVDLDGPEAMSAWDQLWDRHEFANDKGRLWDGGLWPVIRTRRGYHIYFDASQNDFKNTASKLGPGIDTRGNGGMVIAPGSVVGGRSYRLVAGHLNSVEFAPDWLARKLVKPKTLGKHRPAGGFLKPSLHRAERELTKWCKRIADADWGTQNNTINTAAYVLRGFIPPLDMEYVIDQLEIAAEQGNHPRDRARATIRSGLGC